VFLPFGHTWFKPDQYEQPHEKKFELSHLRGTLLKTYGQSLRHELLDRKNEIKILTNFYATYGDRHNIENARIGKEEVFGNSMFGVAIENTSHNGYFTEKILDCFLLKTIPVYWGCSSITNFFEQDGIITFSNIDDLIVKVNQLDETYYNDRLDVIEKNYNSALLYVNYEQNIVNALTQIFEINSLI
jgi:vacuolar-type H+-ATPase subunit C/Vma6